MTKLNGWRIGSTLLPICLAMAIGAQAQTFNTLVTFDGTDGAGPWEETLVQGADGNFYGTTAGGGAYNTGTVFKLSSAGILTILHSFCFQGPQCNGYVPYAGLVLGTNGSFYGTTYHGVGGGAVFKITPQGLLTALANVPNPVAALVEGRDGDFYGTTEGGGHDYGTVFEITPGTGKLTTLYNFCAENKCADGYNPSGALVLANDGNFYGTTQLGGANGDGTVFKITPDGRLTTLYSFCAQLQCADGEYPVAALIQATNGRFYGTTPFGGNLACNAPIGCGTVFEISAAGALTTLHRFQGTDGGIPYDALVQASDGNFYGATAFEGSDLCTWDWGGCGTVFEITPAGKLTTLHSFCLQTGCADGASPFGGLLQATNGTFYGTSSYGGDAITSCLGSNGTGCGTVFNISTGLGPFVAFVRGFGKVGQTGGILGQGLTGTTGVMLNGIPANFTIVSDTYITATVPVGATTGYVTVTTPTGVLTSNVPFLVIQ